MVSCRPLSLPGQASWPPAKLSFGWIATLTMPAPVPRARPMYLRQPEIAQLVVKSNSQR